MSDTAAVVTVTAHPFEASPWWERCTVCRESMAAHATVHPMTAHEMAEDLAEHDWRCPQCIQLDRDRVNADGTLGRIHTVCTHRWGETDGSV